MFWLFHLVEIDYVLGFEVLKFFEPARFELELAKCEEEGLESSCL